LLSLAVIVVAALIADPHGETTNYANVGEPVEFQNRTLVVIEGERDLRVTGPNPPRMEDEFVRLNPTVQHRRWFALPRPVRV
jgi:hypothetical protein